MKKKPYIIAGLIFIIPILLFVIAMTVSNISEWTMSDEAKSARDLLKIVHQNPYVSANSQIDYSQIEKLLSGEVKQEVKQEISVIRMVSVPNAPIVKRNDRAEIVLVDNEETKENHLLFRLDYAIMSGSNYDENTVYFDADSKMLFTRATLRHVKELEKRENGAARDYFANLYDQMKEVMAIYSAIDNEGSYAHRVYPEDYIKELEGYMDL